MKKELDYQNIYDATFDKEYKARYEKLKAILETDDDYTCSDKFIRFKQQLGKEQSALMNNEHGFTDNYFHELVREFGFRGRTYKRNSIKRFFENELIAIKKEHLVMTKNSRLIIGKYNEEKTLKYLAVYFAVKELFDDMAWINPRPDDTPEMILSQMKNKNKGQTVVGFDGVVDINVIDKPLYYWKYKHSELQKLNELLLHAGKTSENPNFTESFSSQTVKKDQRTEWNKSQVQLVYIFYLLYGIEYKDVRLHDLIPRLFTNGKKEFHSKTLNTTLTNNLKRFSDKDAKLQSGLISIREIVEQLDLTAPK